MRCVARDNEGEEVRKKDVPTGNEKFAGNSAEKIGPPKQLLKGSPRKKGEAKRRGGGTRTVMLKCMQGRGCSVIPLFSPKFQLMCVMKTCFRDMV